MKKIIIASILLFTINSCDKLEESVTTIVTETKEKAQQKAQDVVQETVSDQLGKLVKAENTPFDSIFPNQNNLVLREFVGKKMTYPNGSPFYVFKYKFADKELLLKTLVDQPTTDEAKSTKEFKKVDGKAIVGKLSFFEKFIPSNSIDMSFLEDLKTDKTIEYYKVKRFPNSSTIIYNPKNEMVYQFVEVEK